MSEEKEVKFSPVLPFDPTRRDNFTSYENAKYVRDLSCMPENPVRKVSDNLLKYFTCKDLEPVKIGGDLPEQQNTEE